jgi:hypothetical protein
VVGDGDRGLHDLLAIKAARTPARRALGTSPYQVEAIAAAGTPPGFCLACRFLAWATPLTAPVSWCLFHRRTSRVED